MNSKTIIIFNSQTLFEILDEIKENLNLNIINANRDNFSNIKTSNFKSYQIISLSKCEIEGCMFIEDTPFKINKLFEKININFLCNQYLTQSKINIGKYSLDLNSRKINNESKSLDLTEKEAELIVFLKTNKKASLKELQKNVWKHSTGLETHTVETHIYRLRKKLSDKFNDNDFIKHDGDGYFIN